MKLASPKNKAFSLTEALIVVGVISIIGFMAAIVIAFIIKSFI